MLTNSCLLGPHGSPATTYTKFGTVTSAIHPQSCPQTALSLHSFFPPHTIRTTVNILWLFFDFYSQSSYANIMNSDTSPSLPSSLLRPHGLAATTYTTLCTVTCTIGLHSSPKQHFLATFFFPPHTNNNG